MLRRAQGAGRSRVARPDRHAPQGVRRASRSTLALALAGLAVLSGCDKVPLTAPTESTITLFASSNFVPANGTTEITANVIEQAGTPVHNGTVVTFTTSLGHIDPVEARTRNGKVTVRLHAGTVSGTARVRAFSGDATSEDLEIAIGGAAAERIILSAEPGSLPASGGTVEIKAVVLDASGNRLPGVPVAFTTSAGQLGAGTVITDGNGEARTSLTSTRTAQVTAVAGGQTAELTVDVVGAPAVTLTPPAPPIVTGEAVLFTLQVTPAQGGSAVTAVTIDFGDGRSRSLGALSGTTTVAHTYSGAGLFTVTVRAVDADGAVGTASAVVNVQAAGPLDVTITSSISGRSVTFTASVTGTSDAVREYRWSFGDGQSRTTTSSVTSHVYGAAGRYTVRVTATSVTGRSGTAVAEVSIQ